MKGVDQLRGARDAPHHEHLQLTRGGGGGHVGVSVSSGQAGYWGYGAGGLSDSNPILGGLVVCAVGVWLLIWAYTHTPRNDPVRRKAMAPLLRFLFGVGVAAISLGCLVLFLSLVYNPTVPHPAVTAVVAGDSLALDLQDILNPYYVSIANSVQDLPFKVAEIDAAHRRITVELSGVDRNARIDFIGSAQSPASRDWHFGAAAGAVGASRWYIQLGDGPPSVTLDPTY